MGEQAKPVLLPRDDVFDHSANMWLLCVCPSNNLWHRFAPVDAAGAHALGEPSLVVLRAVFAVGPDLRAGVACVDDVLQLSSVSLGCRLHNGLPDETGPAVDA